MVDIVVFLEVLRSVVNLSPLQVFRNGSVIIWFIPNIQHIIVLSFHVLQLNIEYLKKNYLSSYIFLSFILAFIRKNPSVLTFPKQRKYMPLATKKLHFMDFRINSCTGDFTIRK